MMMIDSFFVYITMCCMCCTAKFSFFLYVMLNESFYKDDGQLSRAEKVKYRRIIVCENTGSACMIDRKYENSF